MTKLRLIITAVLLLSIIGFSWADVSNDPSKVTMKDAVSQKIGQYIPVDILMGGEDVITDVPAILYEMGGGTRTLVPVRFISENLGATVKWDGAKQEVSIFYKDKLIVLTIDKPVAYVNDKAYLLPDSVPPKLMDYNGISRTMVPLRFVSDQLGMDVNWIGATRTATIDKPFQKITAVALDNSGKLPEIVLNTTGLVDATAYYINAATVGGENKLIIDVPNTQLSLGSGAILDASGNAYLGVYAAGINTIEATQLTKNPYKTRLVVDMNQQMGYEVVTESNRVRVRFINSVVSIHTEAIYGAETVIVKTLESPKYNITPFGNKVVIDFIDSKLKVNEGAASNFQVGKGGIDYVSYSQLNPAGIYDPGDEVARVVVTLGEGATYDSVYIEDIGNDLYIYVAGNPLNTINYAKDAVDSSFLSLSTFYPLSISSQFDKASNALTLKLPIDSIGLSEFTEHIDDNIIDKMAITTTETEYVIKMTLAKGTTYTNLSPAGTSDLFAWTFKNSALEFKPFVSKLIVLDPGHGGKDPGAIGLGGSLYEKNLNLEIAQILKRKLENIGFKVYMTRDYDTYIGLYERAYIANDLGADAMVSIHINASENASITGFQTLYSVTHPSSKGFASQMMNQLLKAISGALNKGVIERPNLVVLRESKIPTVMAELGFLSNTTEAQRLADPQYQEQLAEGMYQSIIQFIK